MGRATHRLQEVYRTERVESFIGLDVFILRVLIYSIGNGPGRPAEIEGVEWHKYGGQ